MVKTRSIVWQMAVVEVRETQSLLLVYWTWYTMCQVTFYPTFMSFPLFCFKWFVDFHCKEQNPLGIPYSPAIISVSNWTFRSKVEFFFVMLGVEGMRNCELLWKTSGAVMYGKHLKSYAYFRNDHHLLKFSVMSSPAPQSTFLSSANDLLGKWPYFIELKTLSLTSRQKAH